MQMQSFQLQIANFWKIANKIADNPIVHSPKLKKNVNQTTIEISYQIPIESNSSQIIM